MTLPAPETSPAPFTLTLFGPMRALVAGQPLPPLHSRKSLWLLALLALRQGRPVEREWLAGTLWPDADQDQAFANLRPVLSDLRRALGAEAGRLQSPSRHALCLELSGTDVDVLAFDAAMTRKSPESLAQAVSLYTGPLLEGCAEEWVPQERNAREEDCLQALAILTDAALAAGEYSRATEYSRRAVALDPWRDGARRRLMEALSRGGDTNAALQVYREFITLLRSDPKAAPDPETSALYSRLRAEAKPRAAASPVVVVEGPAPVVSGYLPHPLTELIGREDERLEVAAKLRRSRLVTLTGPGGIGKTRLALAIATEVAPEFADGVWLVSLESLADEVRLEGQIASVLGLKETPGQSWRESLTQHLRAKRLLLVLDNCEQLLAASAQIAEYLLDRCGGVRMLATSREVLGITGETAWRVPSLAVPDPMHLPTGKTTLVRVLLGYESVQLFVQRAQAVHQDFALTGDSAAAVAQICSRLEGIPLAIELAAARVRAQTVEQIAARLENHLSLLTGESRAGPSRQQTLRATLDWSFALLSEAERLLLGKLSVFAGGWSLEAAEQVCAREGMKEGQVQDFLTGLVDKSLVVFDQQSVGGRYRFLETVRQYAAERLWASGEAEQVQDRHREWCVILAEEAEPHLSGPEQTTRLRKLDLEHANMQAALEWCGANMERAKAGLRLATALCRFWEMRGHYTEGRKLLARALEQAGEQVNGAARARALTGAGNLAQKQSDYAAAWTLYDEALHLCRSSDDRAGVANLLRNLGVTASSQGKNAEAREFFEKSLSIQRELGNRGDIAQTLGHQGTLSRMQGEQAAARELYEESLRLFRELGDRSRILWMLRCIGSVAYGQGDYRTARDLGEESLDLAREDGERIGVAASLVTLGAVSLAQGDMRAARSYFEESLSLSRALDEPANAAWALLCLGIADCALDDAASGQDRYEQGLSIFREIGNQRGEAWALFYMAEAAQSQDPLEFAQVRYQDSIKILQTIGDQGGIWRCLNGLAMVMFNQDKMQPATRLWGASEALRQLAGDPQMSQEQAEYDRRVAQARSVLGQDSFVATWEEGRALSLEQAVVYALEAE